MIGLSLKLVVGSLLLFSLTACTFGRPRMAAQTVVQVNERKLSAKDFSERLARQLKKLDALSAKDPNSTQRAKDEIIRNFVLQSLVLDFAKANGVAISDQEVETEVNSVRSQYPDDLSFRRALAEESISLSDWREQVRATVLDKRVFEQIGAKAQKPNPEDLRRYYEENKERYRRKERIFLRQIVVDDLTKAETIKDEIRKGDFYKLASKYSVAPEAKNGGEVGWIEKGSVDIFDKAFNLPVGGVSQVLESSYGFHIFKVERKSPAGFSSFDEVKSQIDRAIMAKREQAEFMGWLDQQIRGSKVLKNVALIQSIQVETRGEKK